MRRMFALVVLLLSLQPLRAAGKIGEPLPSPFKVQTLKGKTIDLSQTGARVLIVDLWATWCPPCRAEVPNFVDLYKKYKKQGLLIVGIDVDEPVSRVKGFVQRYKVNYPIVLGGRRELSMVGGVNGLPTTLIIDARGVIRAKAVGFHPREYFEQWILRLLQEAEASSRP